MNTTIGEENKEGHSRISRRKLLASIGMAGAAFATAGMLGHKKAFSASNANSNGVTNTVYGGGNGGGGGGGFGLLKHCVRPTTIDDLRATRVQDAPGTYYVTDSGREGNFVYDPADTATPDNNGTVIVSAEGARFKRILMSSRIDVRWFGAIGDGTTDDTLAIQQANDYAATQKSEVYFPAGIYQAHGLKPTASWLADGNAMIRNSRTGTLDLWTFVYVTAENIHFDGLVFDGNVSADPTAWNAGNLDAFTGAMSCVVQYSKRITFRNCTFQNSMNSPLRLQESEFIVLENCVMRKGRGAFGDGVYIRKCHHIQLDKCLAEDYTRIGFVGEYGCTNITFSQCWARSGHDGSIFYGGTEYNAGFWMENCQNVLLSQCISENNRHRGFVITTGPNTASLVPTAAFSLQSCLSLDNKELGFSLGTWTNHPVNIVCEHCYAVRSEKGFLMTLFDHRDVMTLNNCYVFIPSNAAVDTVGYAVKNYQTGSAQTVTSKINIVNCVSDYSSMDANKLLSQTSDSADFACIAEPISGRSSGGGMVVITIDNFAHAKQGSSVVIKSRLGAPSFRINNSYVTVPVIADFNSLKFTNCRLTVLDHEFGNTGCQGDVFLNDSELQGNLRITTKGNVFMRNVLFRIEPKKGLSIIRSGNAFTRFSECQFQKNMTTTGSVVQIDSSLAAGSRFFFHDCLFVNTSNVVVTNKSFVSCTNSNVVEPYFSGCYSDNTVPSLLEIGGTLSAPAGNTVIPMY